jgi:adenosylcobyric acid synthase
MAVREYHAYQPEVWPVVTAAYDRLRAANDLIVIEGAGSPAEINLRGQDIVNMRMALHAQSPTLLIGDIDRGGVFASLVGHMELFTLEERELIAAFIINKFRGDVTLLDSGIDFLFERTGVPTLGVVPMLADWRGDEEDSLGIEDRRRRAKPDAPLQIAVVRLPFISNYTDFDALADEPDVNVRYATRADELEGAAAILLPGTKSTIADLGWLRESGGYQMLGRRIHDPEHVESDAGSVEGLGLLDAETTFGGDKRTVRVEGELLSLTGPDTRLAGALGPAGTPLHGYEIHMGRTTLGPGAEPLLRLRGADGSEHDDGAAQAAPAGGGSAAPAVVCGSYVHGLFDYPVLRATFLNGLREGLGLPAHASAAPSPDDDIDRLADHVEAYLDPSLLERIVGLEAR